MPGVFGIAFNACVVKNSECSRIIGIRTDFQNAGESRNSVVNAMIEMSCGRVVRSVEEVLETLSEVIL